NRGVGEISRDSSFSLHFQRARHSCRIYSHLAGWSSLVAQHAHNLKVAGSNPAPATNLFQTAVAYRVYVIQNREGKFYIGLSDDADLRRLRGWRVRVIRFSLIRQRIQVTESESIDAGNAPALHLCRCREKLAREIAVYRMQ